MQFVKINQCSNNSYWYKDLIGQTFKLEGTTRFEVKTGPKDSNSCVLVLHGGLQHIVIVEDMTLI